MVSTHTHLSITKLCCTSAMLSGKVFHNHTLKTAVQSASSSPRLMVKVHAQSPRPNQNKMKDKIKNLENALVTALNDLDQAYQFDTTHQLVATHEIVEDLSFALRRYQTFHEQDPLEVMCIDEPDLPECRTFDL